MTTTNQAIERKTVWEISGYRITTDSPISRHGAVLHKKQAFRGIAQSGTVVRSDHTTYTWRCEKVGA